jgi:D-threo-aldose 1-dehydrogenase
MPSRSASVRDAEPKETIGMDPTATRLLGRTGVELTQLGFGGAPLGDLFVKISEADAEQTLATAWNSGLRYFDTAPWYGRGQSEHRTGRFLYRQPRRDFVLSTKVGRVLRAPFEPEKFDPTGWAGGLHFEHRFDYSYDGIMRAYEDSLQRLGVNRIDLLVVHDLDFWFHATEQKVTAYLDQLFTSGWRALDELKASGRIRGIGAGINELGMMPRFLDLVDLDFFLLAMRYTLLEQDTLETELPLCAQRGVGIVIGGVFNSGILATGAVPGAKYNYADAPADVMTKVRRIEAICQRHDVALAAAALQFPMGHPSIASVIPGGLHPDHVERNVAQFRRNIPQDLWAELKSEKLLREDAPTPPSGG